MCQEWYTRIHPQLYTDLARFPGTPTATYLVKRTEKKMTLSQKLQMLFTIQYLHNTDCCIVTGLLSLSSYIPIYIQLFICYIGRADLDVDFSGS